MTETTARFALPLIAPGQAQKEMTHNEALAAIDLALQPCVVAVGVDVPPADPEAGACWIVGAAPGGTWAGRAHAIAGWTGGGWRFVAAREGMTAAVAGAAYRARFDGEAWTTGVIAGTRLEIGGVALLAAPAPAIDSPAGGAVIDAQARAAIAAIVDALTHHGLVNSG